jgi:thiaminase/transcriptional activator TenA
MSMKAPGTFQRDPKTLFGRLTGACSQEWEAYCTHEFVRRIGDAGLPERCFRHYLEQDYLFLIHFARAWALAVYKSETLADMRAAATVVNDILHREMQLHVRYCARWGLTEEALEDVPEATANMAYTRYVLERGLSGDALDLHVALAPCVIGYADIAGRLTADPSTKREGNPYWDWIESYAGEDYQQVAGAAVHRLDELAAARMGPGRFASLARTFRQATLLEIGFWEMGLNVAV